MRCSFVLDLLDVEIFPLINHLFKLLINDKNPKHKQDKTMSIINVLRIKIFSFTLFFSSTKQTLCLTYSVQTTLFVLFLLHLISQPVEGMIVLPLHLQHSPKGRLIIKAIAKTYEIQTLLYHNGNLFVHLALVF